MKKILFTIMAAALLTACGTSNTLNGGTGAKLPVQEGKATTAQEQLDYVRKVNDNAVYAKNLSAKTTLTITTPEKNITVDGRLQMRKDDVIRITVTPFGLMEVGRLEFTPEYVLLINRLEKEYVKATYSDLDFLKDNGLDFYSLQSLFWNELFMPGKKALSDGDLAHFTVNTTDAQASSITNKSGRLTFQWLTNAGMAQIDKAEITYDKGTPQASAMTFSYANFVPVGSKRFPSKIEMAFNSKASSGDKMALLLTLGRISEDAGWEARSSVSGKYTQVSAQEIFNKLVSM